MINQVDSNLTFGLVLTAGALMAALYLRWTSRHYSRADLGRASSIAALSAGLILIGTLISTAF